MARMCFASTAALAAGWALWLGPASAQATDAVEPMAREAFDGFRVHCLANMANPKLVRDGAREMKYAPVPADLIKRLGTDEAWYVPSERGSIILGLDAKGHCGVVAQDVDVAGFARLLEERLSIKAAIDEVVNNWRTRIYSLVYDNRSATLRLRQAANVVQRGPISVTISDVRLMPPPVQAAVPPAVQAAVPPAVQAAVPPAVQAAAPPPVPSPSVIPAPQPADPPAALPPAASAPPADPAPAEPSKADTTVVAQAIPPAAPAAAPPVGNPAAATPPAATPPAASPPAAAPAPATARPPGAVASGPRAGKDGAVQTVFPGQAAIAAWDPNKRAIENTLTVAFADACYQTRAQPTDVLARAQQQKWRPLQAAMIGGGFDFAWTTPEAPPEQVLVFYDSLKTRCCASMFGVHKLDLLTAATRRFSLAPEKAYAMGGKEVLQFKPRKDYRISVDFEPAEDGTTFANICYVSR
ncbi:MAG: hypothetical protein IT562_17360 [Alphaproteobacteria bacterium]|nr:hypothetical protein [Alphaproteobacteria bacterium]